MHKQNDKRKGKSRIKHSNANTRLPESSTIAIRELLSSWDGQGSFSVSYLQEQYLSKFCSPDLVPPGLRRSAAISKWLQTEKVNRHTNLVIRGRDRGYNILPRVSWYAFLGFAQRIIESVLGPLSNEVVVGSFSGGASTSRRRASSSSAEKFVGQADLTGAASPYVDLIHREVPLLRQLGIFYDLREVIGAELFTVPKKTDIDRCACKEPDINMYLQKGVGDHIRRRLRRFGINLNDQSVNRRLAHSGSLDDSLATLDLSSASDTITISCVEALLPRNWFLYLNDIRSQYVWVDGRYHRTDMFSSMGNGFTFELESLIFYALMRATSYFENCRGVISVYGDDLIIPSGMADSAIWVLSQFGFTVNESKSFSTGPFRESCGGHYHLGEDVTPFYLKRPAERLTDLIRVANQLRRWAFADPARQYELPFLYNVWKQLADLVPRDLWGGYDYSVDTQLVAPTAPRNVLVRVQESKDLPDLGLYSVWHNSYWNRSSAAQPSSRPTSTSNFCRRRRAKRGAPACRDFFHEELV